MKKNYICTKIKQNQRGILKKGVKYMIIGLCTVKLRIPMAQSLKDKRKVLKSLLQKGKNKFNIAIAEVDQNDLWQSSTIAFVTITNDISYLDRLLDKVINFIADFNGVQMIDYSIEHL